MSTPLYGQISGTYVSDGTARVLPLRFDPDYFALFNQTNFNDMDATGVTKRAWWFRSLDPDNAFTVKNTDLALTDQSDFVTSGGFRLINTITDVLEPAVAGLAITTTNPAVVAATGHPYVVGDVVRLFSTTDMLQIAGMDFTITATTPGVDFDIGYLDASAFGAAAIANTSRRLPFDPPDFAPKNRFITNITQAVNAVITLSVDHGYNVNEIISLRCTPAFGMSEVDGAQGQILAIDTTLNTVTVNINTTSFTAFAFPTSAIAGAIDNQAFIGLRLGLDVVGVADDVVHWVATKGLFGIA